MDIWYFFRQALSATPRFSPDSTALAFEDFDDLSLRQIINKSESLATALKLRGVSPGDRIGLLMYNGLEYWIAYFATVRIGAIAVRINFRLGPDELDFILRDSGTTTLIGDQSLLAPIRLHLDSLPIKTVINVGEADEDSRGWIPFDATLQSTPALDDVPLPQPNTPAMLMYTSGTTGRPKGALWSHQNTTWWIAMQQIEWGFTHESVTLVTGPLYHVGGLENYALPTMAAGGKAVMMKSTGFELSRALKLVEEMRVTDLLLFPSMINELLNQAEEYEFDLSSLKRIFTGGDALAPSVGQKLGELLPNVSLVQVYGLTEGTPIASCGESDPSTKSFNDVGRSFPFSEVSVRDEAGNVLPDNQVGEIWTRSPANAVGYWNRPEDTADTFADGWCRTGDVGETTAGHLRITGRIKDIIRSGGENISPAEIEDVLLQHPDIIDAAVVGVPDPKYVESVCAVVVSANGSELGNAEVIKWCESRLAGYKKPRRIEFRTELPRTPSLKIQKFRLRRELSEGM